MRIYHDVRGIEVALVELHWLETYAFWLEGSPRLMNQIILGDHLDRALARWPNAPHLVLGQDERREHERLPPERVLCYLTSTWRPVGKEDGSTHLVLGWFGDPGDPFERLRTVLHDIDWSAQSRYLDGDST